MEMAEMELLVLTFNSRDYYVLSNFHSLEFHTL